MKWDDETKKRMYDKRHAVTLLKSNLESMFDDARRRLIDIFMEIGVEAAQSILFHDQKSPLKFGVTVNEESLEVEKIILSMELTIPNNKELEEIIKKFSESSPYQYVKDTLGDRHAQSEAI